MEISTNGVRGGEAGPTKKQLPEESIHKFSEGIYLILSCWTALQLAVENEWGGHGSRSLADQLGSDIFTWFTQSKEPLYIDDLENILEEGMLTLNTMIDDGSIEEVAEKLMIIHEECLEGNYSSIAKLREAGPRSVSHQCIKQPTVDEDDEEDIDDEDDTMGDDRTNMMQFTPVFQSKSNSVSVSDSAAIAKEAQTEDGWAVVSSRRNKGKKN